MEIICKVKEIGQTVQVSDKFKKRDLIVEYAENPTYPEFVKFEAHQDKCDKLNELSVGDEINLSFNIRGRPWTDKTGKTIYFNTLAIWKFNINSKGAGQYTPEFAPPVDISSAPGEDDDLPF